MNLASVRIITGNMQRMVGFYESITGLSASWQTEEFAELRTPACTLAIGSARTMELFGRGAAQPADNHTVIVEFRVDDVDQHFARIRQSLPEIVQEPVTQPWGNRSLLFRDPDGNLVNFFAPVSPQAAGKSS